MSASSKKKLRNELNAAAMTEKQQKEIQEAKKLRLYSALFIAAIAVMLVVVVFTSVVKSGIIERSTTALTVGESEISAPELNHYYVDTVNQYVQQAGSLISLFGLDTTKPLDEQEYTEGQTWADYFLDSATSTAQAMYAYYNDAIANGYTLTDDDKATIDAAVSNFDLYAAFSGMSVDSYIAAAYGAGCNEDTYRHYVEVQVVASNYMQDVQEGMTYTDEDLRNAEAENFNAYSSFTYDYYYLAASKFYEGGTKDEETGTTTYTDAEKEAGRAAAEEAANFLLTATTVEELNTAIAALGINAESTTASSTKSADVAYNSVPAAIREWVTASERKEGDIAVLANEYTSTDADGHETTTVNGYYVVRYDSKNDNLTKLINVRHILIAPEGGTYDSTTGTTKYSEEEMAAAKTEAEALLKQFQEGDATEEAFAELANKNSADSDGTDGGLYEEVYPGEMVTNFNDWCFAEGRKAGDTGIVESPYGYHIMYFSGVCEKTYRDLMIENALRSDDMVAFETALLEKQPLTVVNTKYLNSDLVIGSAS